MTIDEMNKVKEIRGYSFAQLSDYTGVPIVTLQRVFTGATKNPRRATLDAIERVLKGDESVFSGKAYSYGEKRAFHIRMMRRGQESFQRMSLFMAESADLVIMRRLMII